MSQITNKNGVSKHEQIEAMYKKGSSQIICLDKFKIQGCLRDTSHEGVP